MMSNGTGYGGHEIYGGLAGESAIEAHAVGRRYRRGWALRDCSFRLPAGRICGLVGPNGAGKTTLMSIAANLLEPTSGTLRVFGAAPQSAGGRPAYGVPRPGEAAVPALHRRRDPAVRP